MFYRKTGSNLRHNIRSQKERKRDGSFTQKNLESKKVKKKLEIQLHENMGQYKERHYKLQIQKKGEKQESATQKIFSTQTKKKFYILKKLCLLMFKIHNIKWTR